MSSELARLTRDAKKEIKAIQTEVQRKSGEKPSESEVIEGILEAVDRETAAALTFEKRSKKNRDKGKSVFDDLFSL